jgi:hypothetical protein
VLSGDNAVGAGSWILLGGDNAAGLWNRILGGDNTVGVRNGIVRRAQILNPLGLPATVGGVLACLFL